MEALSLDTMALNSWVYNKWHHASESDGATTNVLISATNASSWLYEKLITEASEING